MSRIEFTGVAVLMKDGKWGIETTAEEFKRVLGDQRYQEELNYRIDYGNVTDPWIIQPHEVLKIWGHDDDRSVVELNMRVVDDPELERQQNLVLKYARQSLGSDAEPGGGESKDDGTKDLFHLWFPGSETSVTVRLKPDESGLEILDRN